MSDTVQFGYTPNAWQTRFHKSISRHICLVGGYGSGKTTAACMEHIALALEYPGSRWIVGRKTLPSLRITILKSFMAACPQEIIREFNKAQMVVTLMNGSEFIFLPLDEPEKLKSLEISGFIIEEANEVEKEIYDRLKDRMRQKLPDGTRPRYRSTIMLNPTDEEHWIPQLFLYAKPANSELFQSTTIDNMLHLPQEYIEELKSTYSDEMLQRYLYGNFGRVHKGKPVFGTFDRKLHVRHFEYDPTLTLVRGWDFGFNHPVVSWLQMVGDQIRVLNVLRGKKIYLHDFINGAPGFDGVLREQDKLFGPNRSTRDFCDPRGSDESDKGVTSISILNRNSIYPIYRRTWIEEGLDAIKMKLDTKNKANGEPNLIVHPRCKNLIEGFLGGYHRDQDDTPVKDNIYDNECIAHGEMVLTASGFKEIQFIVVGDLVWTRAGLKPVYATHKKGIRDVMNFHDVDMTPDHKVWSKEYGFKEALTHSDTLYTTWDLWKSSLLLWFLTELNTDVIQKQNSGAIGFISQHRSGLLSKVLPQIFIEMFGSSIMEKFLKVFTFIIKTTILSITTLAIWSLLKLVPTLQNIWLRENKIQCGWQWLVKTWQKLTRRHLYGMGLKKGLLGIKIMQNFLFQKKPGLRLLKTAFSAAVNIKQTILYRINQGFVPTCVRQGIAEQINSTMKLERVSFASLLFLAISLMKQKLVHASVQVVSYQKQKEVYDLSVADCHEFFVKSFLVKNCDAVRYAVVHMVQQAAINRQMMRQDFNKAHVNKHTGRRIEI